MKKQNIDFNRPIQNHHPDWNRQSDPDGSQNRPLQARRGPSEGLRGREQGPGSGESGRACEAASSCGADGERITETLRSSQLRCGDCSELLHQLSNTMTGVLMNVQLLGWKLPPYSRLKRPVLEVERNAQRAGELLKRLLQRLEAGRFEPVGSQECDALAPPEPEREAGEGLAILPASGAAVSVPGFLPQPDELTLACDPCTSGFFPKRDDSR